MTLEEKSCQMATLYGSGRVLKDALPQDNWKTEVWKDGIYDDFDVEDMKYLCNKLNLEIDEVFENKGDLIKLNLRKEQVESCNYQLVLVF
jgi:hypothetical protein